MFKEIVGEFFVDLLVEEKIIIEIKVVKELIDIHEIQLLNYLKGCNVEVGLLINFSESVETKRKYFKESEQSEKSGAKK